MVNLLVRSYNEVEGQLKDDECARLYQDDPNVAIAKIYKRYQGMLITMGRKFYSLNTEDVESISFEVIDKALRTYSIKGKGNFATYLTHLMKNALKNELRALTIESVKRDWYMDVTFERGDEDEDGVLNPFDVRGEEEEGYFSIEVLESAKLASVTTNQYNYVQAIISAGYELSDAEVARVIGVSRSSIAEIKKGLRNKLKDIL